MRLTTIAQTVRFMETAPTMPMVECPCCCMRLFRGSRRLSHDPPL